MKKIDFVIPWVNGNDPKWLANKKLYLPSNASSMNVSDVRFRDYNTLKYVFRSIEYFASWVHRIYLITDNQTPEWLDVNNSKVTVIDHKQIIDKQYLPIFNSNVIDWNIDNIPNLEEQFVYFNDDTLLNRKLKPEDFFIDGKPRDSRLYTDLIPSSDFDHIVVNNDILMNTWLNGKWPLSKKGLWYKGYSLKRLRNLIFLPQIKKSGIMGYVEPHGPMAFTKNSFRKVKRIWGPEIEKVYYHRFRSPEDISIWLVRHFQLETGDFEPRSDLSNHYSNIGNISEIEDYLMHNKSETICINDDENIDNYQLKVKKIQSILEKKFPKKSLFEK